MKLHPQQIENIIRLSPDDRYGYTIREIVKHGEVWLVARSDAWVTITGYSPFSTR